jgi:hypothetical protein
LSLKIRALRAHRGLRDFHEQRFQVDIALADRFGSAFAGALVVARTDPGPGGQMGFGVKDAHVNAEFGKDPRCGTAAVAAALTLPAGTYNVVDDEPLTKGEYADALTRAAGKSSWVRVPGRLALLMGDRLTSLTPSLRVSNRRFRRLANWVPTYPSAREGWIATAAALNAD